MNERYALVVHGGAFLQEGDYAPQNAFIRTVLEQGRTRLREGASAIDAAVEATRALEDSGLFIAGKGSGPNTAGYYELDSSVMDGASGKAGSVCALTHFRNPVLCARAVMDRTPHVLLAGPGLARFLEGEGMEQVTPAQYYKSARPMEGDVNHGTVGAVALDMRGNLATAVSTGGIKGKLEGRVGDPAIIGASIFADADYAVCSTGHGEYFMRAVAAYDVVAQCRYAGTSLHDAVRQTLDVRVTGAGGWGGMIALSKAGDITTHFTRRGMHRGHVTENGDIFVASY